MIFPVSLDIGSTDSSPIGLQKDVFHCLLQQLSQEHLRQLVALQNENAALRNSNEALFGGVNGNGHLAVDSHNEDGSISYAKKVESLGKCTDVLESSVDVEDAAKVKMPRVSLPPSFEHLADLRTTQGQELRMHAAEPKESFKNEIAVCPAGDDVDMQETSKSCPMESPCSGNDTSRTSSKQLSRQKSYLSEHTSHTAKSKRPKTPTCNFELLSYWEEMGCTLSEKRLGFSLSRTKAMSSSFELRSMSQPELIKSDRCKVCQMVIIRPTSNKRLCWDLLSMLLLGYDVLVIPFTIAFEPQDDFFQRFMTWFSLIWWSLDIVLTFCTGYAEGKQLVLKPRLIACRYFKFWFWPDLAIVGCDWVLILKTQGGGGSVARLGRTLRWIRFVRALRLMRIAKLKRIVQDVQDQISTEAVSIWFGILKVVILLLFTNHIVACLWYMIGLIDPQDGWVETKMHDRDTAYRYATSLHWSLAQFTPAPNEIFPQTAYERCFALIVLVTALVAFSAFVSTVTAGVVQLRNMQSEQSRQFWLLRRYLRDWSVRPMFRLRVIRYLEYAYNKQRQRVQEKDVTLLELLSEPMRDELRHETLHVHLMSHALFYRCGDTMRMFSKALVSSNLALGDPVFSCGEQANGMIFVGSGMLEYFLGEVQTESGGDKTSSTGPSAGTPSVAPTASASSTEAPIFPPVYLVPGQWAAEVALWCSWLYLGDLHAVSECQIVLVDINTFAPCIRMKRWMWTSMSRYAANFLRKLNQIPNEDLSDLLHREFMPQNLLDDSISFGEAQQDLSNLEDDVVQASLGSRLIRGLRRYLNVPRQNLQ